MYDFEHMDKRLIIYVNTFLVANRLQAAMDAELKGITAKQWLVLITLDDFEMPPTLKELAEKCNTTHQNTKQIVLKLREKGYVDIVKDDKDGRAVRIIKLSKVQELDQKYKQRSEEFIRDMFGDLSQEEIEIMCRAQMKIYEQLANISKVNRNENKELKRL